MKTSNIFWIFVIIVTILVVGAVAGSGGGITSSSRTICKFTINAAPQVTSVMIDEIIYTNKNTMLEPVYIAYNELPKSFKFRKGDILSFNLTAKSGYALNYWLPDSGIPDPENPLEINTAKDGSFTLTVWMMRVRSTTTP